MVTEESLRLQLYMYYQTLVEYTFFRVNCRMKTTIASVVSSTVNI